MMKMIWMDSASQPNSRFQGSRVPVPFWGGSANKRSTPLPEWELLGVIADKIRLDRYTEIK